MTRSPSFTSPPINPVQSGRHLTSVPLGSGLPAVEDMWTEIHGYMDVLLGRAAPPVDSPYLGMHEVATAYYGRARELEALIHRAERRELVKRGSEYQRFRTGELEAFIKMAGRCADLGSRRLTQEQMLQDARRSV